MFQELSYGIKDVRFGLILFLYFLIKHSTTCSMRGIAPQNNLVLGEANSILLREKAI
jgi:hypothetical protein